MIERPSRPARFGRHGGRIGRPSRAADDQQVAREIERLFRGAKARNRARMTLTEADIWSGPTTAALAADASAVAGYWEDT